MIGRIHRTGRFRAMPARMETTLPSPIDSRCIAMDTAVPDARCGVSRCSENWPDEG